MIVNGGKEENNIKFKRINSFSRVRRGSNFNAFQRKNLGSIPSKMDNFIFKLPEVSKNNLSDILKPILLKEENLCFRKDIFNNDHKYLKNFGSGNSIEVKGSSLKFSVNNNIKTLKNNKSEFDLNNLEKFKTIYTIGNVSTPHSKLLENKDEKKILAEKDNKTKLKVKNNFGKEDRYNNIFYRKEMIDKYYPGPGEYNSLNNKNYNQFRYESLFKGKCSFPIPSINDNNNRIGPGSYDYLEKRNIPGGSFSILKKYKDQYKEYVGPTSLDLPGAFNIKDRDKNNHFFISEIYKKKENLEKKYGIIRPENKIIEKENKFIIPRWLYSEKGKDFNSEWINKSLEKKINEMKKKGNLIDVNENINYKLKDDEPKQNIYYWARMAKDEDEKGIEEAKKRKGAFSFSKIPKLVMKNENKPGPGYYEHNSILYALKLKKEFNSNIFHKWI